jgi:hypothetical protein
MKVVALETGYHGGILRHENDQFDVPDGSKAKWFVPVAKTQDTPKPGTDKGQRPGAGLV